MCKRTIEDFVEDLISDGRTPKQIRAVARSTRWEHFSEEAFSIAEGLYRPRKKKVSNIEALRKKLRKTKKAC